MHEYLDEFLKGAKTEAHVKEAIKKAFAKIEAEWLEVVRLSFNYGFAKTAYVGSCALISVVIDNKLYTASCGDSKGVLLRETKSKDQTTTFEAINISKTFSANKKYEQERLKKEFSAEKDAFICKRGDPKACYVKGGLMPTRSLGDFRLKLREFNFHNFDADLGYRRPIP